MYLDFHTHRQRHPNEAEVIEILSQHPGKEKFSQYFTLGYHPWWTTEPLSLKQIDHLRENYLHQENCLAIGELGLDKLHPPSLAIQMHITQQQLALAEELQAPVIIHCVRQYDSLHHLKKNFPKIPAWIIHGYYRQKTLAHQLIQEGFYLSFCCHPNAPKSFQEAVVSLPLEKIFLETDSYPEINIKEVYNHTAYIKGLEVPVLQQQIMINLKNVFPKWQHG